MIDWLTFVAAAVAAVGTFVMPLLVRRSSRESAAWSRRAEALSLMRWATELALSEQRERSWAGTIALEELMDSRLLHSEDSRLASALLRAVYDDDDRGGKD